MTMDVSHVMDILKDCAESRPALFDELLNELINATTDQTQEMLDAIEQENARRIRAKDTSGSDLAENMKLSIELLIDLRKRMVRIEESMSGRAKLPSPKAKSAKKAVKKTATKKATTRKR